MSKSYFFSALSRQDLIDINDYIAKNDIGVVDAGIEIIRVVSGYRDLPALFADESNL
jgi:plasmid stabilization system protein ParE